ncbi:MAG: hypothetical protein KJP21_08230 [Bacteroidia bacterium]|nr:hypothetical protein [Bacteroidia bacterium]NNJ56265.1 hypothetical protein [Bacteroidia bacterium]
MKLPIPLLLVFLSLSSSLYSAKTVDDIRFIVDPSDKVENNSFQFGIQLFLSNQKIIETKGYLNGTFSWKNIEVQSNQITKIDDGVFFVDHRKIRENNHKVDFIIKIRYKRKNYSYIHSIEFPELDSLTLVNRKLQAYKDNYLRIYGYFSNSKTYLLSSDTEYPGFSSSEITIHAPREVAQNDLFLYYHPQWSELDHDIPIKLTSNQISQEICLRTDYSTPIKIEKIGAYGKNGEDGNSGTSGDDGYEGYPGENGWDGGFGQQPNDVFAYLAEKDGYLLCWLIQDNRQKKYIIDHHGSVTITSKGGEGGDGGNGGEGGQGSHATEEYDAGNGGQGGNGGRGGDGGNGGNIIIYHDLHPDVAKRIIYGKSIGGSPGEGGSGGRGGKDGIEDNSETPILGLLSLIIRTRGPHGDDGKNGSYGEIGNVVYKCMNSEEYVAIHETFNIEL